MHKRLTEDIIYGFTKTVLAHKFDAPVPTPEFHKELWKLCCDPHPYIAIAAPRGHAKSTTVSLCYVLCEILFRTSDYVLIISDTEPQAIQFLADIKSELTENETIRQLFEVKELLKDNEKDIIVCFGKDNHKVRITAKSSGTAIRGMKWRNKRPNLVIGDDLENEEIVMNAERRNKFKVWFYGAVMQCISDKGKIRIVGTILHFDSFLESLMPPTSGPGSEFTVEEDLKIWSKDPSRPWKSIKFKAHPATDDFSVLLWEHKFSKEKLQTIRQSFINQGIPEVYAQEYLNYPIDESSAFFKKEDFLEATPEQLKLPMVHYTGLDLAVSTKEKSSYTAIVTIGVDENGCIFVLDVKRGRWDSKQVVDEIFSTQIRWKPVMMVVEKGPIEKSLGPFIKEEMMKNTSTRDYINFHLMPAVGDKRARARSIQGRMRAGTVRFNKQTSWYSAFEEELLRFDRGAHDDQVDAFAWLGMLLKDLFRGPTKEDLEEERYNDLVRESLADAEESGAAPSIFFGDHSRRNAMMYKRNDVTGY